MECGICDYCRTEKGKLSNVLYEAIARRIKKLLVQHPFTIEELAREANGINPDQLIVVVQYLLDKRWIEMDHRMRYRWIK
jgi:hypothetical protein